MEPSSLFLLMIIIMAVTLPFINIYAIGFFLRLTKDGFMGLLIPTLLALFSFFLLLIPYVALLRVYDFLEIFPMLFFGVLVVLVISIINTMEGLNIANKFEQKKSRR